MSRIFILFGTMLVSAILALGLILALPGHYHLDETKLEAQQGSLDWTRSWDHPDQTLTELVLTTFGYTFSLQLMSFLLVLIFSFVLSLVSLRWEYSRGLVEKILSIGISAPSLFWIPLLVYLLSLKWNLLPFRFEPNVKGWILPLIALTLRPLCLSAQILLTEWKKSEKQNYFLVARSKGLSKIQVFIRHGLKNALIPFSAQMGNFLVQSLIGSVLVESLFAFPGMGLLFVQSLQNRDLPVVLTLTLLFTAIMILVHGIVEIFQNYLEPRSQQAET